MNSLSLDHIWQKRWNQDIDGAIEGFSTFCKNHRFDVTELKGQNLDSIDLVEATLLQASLYRAERKQRKSSQLIAKVHKNAKVRPFRLYFELGIDHWVAGDTSSALDCFLQAENLALTTHQSFYSLTNLLWCLEELDFERKKIETKIEILLKDLCIESFSHAYEQWLAYKRRKLFYQEAKVDTVPMYVKSQADYFAHYTSYLPFSDKKNFYDVESLSFKDNYLWQGSFRYRTLCGHYIPSDKSPLRVGDAIDRLYLWCWYWIGDKKEITLKKLELSLKAVLFELDLDMLGKENQLLLRNALGWLCLICPRLTSGLKTTINFLNKRSGIHYPVLEEEFYFIQLLLGYFYGKECDISKKTLSTFRHYYADITTSEYQLMPGFKAIDLSTKENLNRNSKLKLIVDYSLAEIVMPLVNKKVQSSSIVRFLHLAYNQNQFTVEELDKSFVENKRRLYNLLARVRSLSSDIKICMSKNIIHVSLPRQNIKFIGEYAQSLNSIKTSKCTSFADKAIDEHISYQTLKVIFKKRFKRIDLEKAYGISKATSCRLLEKWLAAKIIEKVGNGRGVYYTWSV